MTCEELMTPRPTCCQVDHTLEEAAEMMKRDNVGAIPVVDLDDLTLIGVLTDRDIAVKAVAEGLDPRHVAVSSVMTPDPVCCEVDEPIENALDRMSEFQVRRLPVVNRRREVLGIISQADIATRLGRARETAEVVEAISTPEPPTSPG